MNDSTFHLILFIIKLVIALLIPLILRYYAKRKNKPFLIYLLFFHQIGPRTDTKYMSKRELYKSGLKFIVWSIYLFTIILLLGYNIGSKSEYAIILGIIFIIWILFMMCFFGGLYLIFRGLIRKKEYIPPEKTKESDIVK